MNRVLILLAALLSLSIPGAAAQKNCKTGIPCGNSCISRDKVCRIGTGSARAAPTILPDVSGRSAPPQRHEPGAPVFVGRCTVSRIYDGDTVTCRDGTKIRLLLIDTPEMGQREIGREARTALLRILPLGTTTRVELDVETTDRYDRTLAYLHLPDGRMVNEEMARSGYALVLSYPPNVKHIDRIRSAVEEAKAARRGLWGTSAFECSPRDYRAKRCGQKDRR